MPYPQLGYHCQAHMTSSKLSCLQRCDLVSNYFKLRYWHYCLLFFVLIFVIIVVIVGWWLALAVTSLVALMKLLNAEPG